MKDPRVKTQLHRVGERTVVFHPADGKVGSQDHDTVTKLRVATRLAALLGLDFEGESTGHPPPAGSKPHYVVPSDTLVGLQHARQLGINGVDDLFGGVVPQPFVATKVITHPLLDPHAAAPVGWQLGFASDVADAVLPGFSVFDLADARRAGRRLLQAGPLRVKDPAGVGGSRQWVLRDAESLDGLLADLDPRAVTSRGLVLERNLADVSTHSVGLIRSGPLRVAYCGTQTCTHNHRGEAVYGGSDLTVTRGGFVDLLQLPLPPPVRRAVEQAWRYHQAALAHFSGMYASRANYDVAQGADARGQACSGVLEASWRIGGASGAELAALAALAENPARQTVRALTCERYGNAPALPAGAWLLYDGIDPHVGRLTKYALAVDDADD